ncbi:MAG TPA: class I SAM-dependent methyltransferase [Vicinamibacterales bacterium]
MNDIHGPELVRRYKTNYGIPDGAPITEAMIRHHWALERRLTRELLSSEPAHRWDVFEHCYTTLYSELPWLNDLTGTLSSESGDEAEDWSRLVGPPPKRIYEVGSGRGRLVAALAGRGYECTATEITRERGSKWTAARPSLRWTVSDGVHLERFEAPESYDAVISDQVIEHLHPDDLVAHFAGVRAILKPGGRYAFATPHAFEGPFDVSRVFGSEQPQGMHLKEYTYRDLQRAVYAAGFERIDAVFRLPRAVRARCGRRPYPRRSRSYLLYLSSIERVISRFPRRLRRHAAGVLRLALWPSGIALVATA